MIRFLQTPGPVKKIILSGILLVFCGAMVVTLIPGGLGSSVGLGAPGQGVVATVDGAPVSALEVQREARQMLRQQFPQGGAQTSMLLPFFANRAAENLINQQIVLAEAERLGLHATDEELRDELQHGRYAATFFPNGNFIGQDAYEGRLQQADLTVAQFEQGVKDQLLLDKLRNLIAGSASVSDAEIRKEFEKRNAKVKFDYAVLQKDDILKSIHPSEAELKAFYEGHKAAYNGAIPEKRKIRYVLVDTAKVQAQTPVTHEDLQAYYNQHRDDFRMDAQVNVRHILIKTPTPGPDGKADPKGVEEARKKAEDVLKQLKAGAKFEDLAKKYSEDTVSAKNGGSLGWIGKGRTVPEFEKSAFSLPKGGTSDLVQSNYGFHIIHVDDQQAAHMKTLDEVKDQVEAIVRNQKAASATDNLARMLLNQARTSGIEQAAAAKGLQVVNTDFIGRTDALPGIGSSNEFMEAVFSAREKSPPDEAQLPQGYAIYELLALKPPATPTFEEIRSRVENEFKSERSGALMSQKTQELADRAKASHNLKKTAQEVGATFKTSDFVLPDGQVPDIGSMTGPAAVAFTMKPGEISGPLNNGNAVAVLCVLERQEPSPADFDGKKDEIRDSLLQNKQGEIFGLFLTNLHDLMEKSGKLKINQEELKKLTRSQNGDEGE